MITAVTRLSDESLFGTAEERASLSEEWAGARYENPVLFDEDTIKGLEKFGALLASLDTAQREIERQLRGSTSELAPVTGDLRTEALVRVVRSLREDCGLTWTEIGAVVVDDYQGKQDSESRGERYRVLLGRRPAEARRGNGRR